MKILIVLFVLLVACDEENTEKSLSEVLQGRWQTLDNQFFLGDGYVDIELINDSISIGGFGVNVRGNFNGNEFIGKKYTNENPPIIDSIHIFIESGKYFIKEPSNNSILAVNDKILTISRLELVILQDTITAIRNSFKIIGVKVNSINS
ncbi:hypothetical protein OAQ99_06325 [Candidatus Kapabacteria bacterium]|nr:hypothetical protein [Candidatus Kapabacteria bacterium]